MNKQPLNSAFFTFWVFIFISLLPKQIFAQESLFESNEMLDIKMEFSIKDLRKESNDSTFVEEVVWVKNEAGEWVEMPIELRVRGNFRLNNCYYPPLRMKIKKKNRKGTIFEENKGIKIVFPCSRSNNSDAYIAKEFMAYQLFEEVSEYVFETRMMRITFINEDKKGNEEFLIGFLLEDDDDVADRFDGEIIKDKKILGTLLEELPAVRHDFFQMMIGNTDFSGLFQHNSKTMLLPGEKLIPLAYDFDMTGLVNPPYAQVSNLVEIESVTDRLYRGFCRDRSVFMTVREEFLEKESRIYDVVDSYEDLLSSSEFKQCRRFIEEFFYILKNDKAFEKQIVLACRNY